jgi:tRNA(fMet)-specific endonuclease VapC
VTDLLDTDLCVAILRGVKRVQRRLEQIPPSQVVVTSVVTAAELLYGAQLADDPSSSEQAVRLLLGGLRVLPLGEAEAQAYATIKAHLRRAGMLIGDNDLFIAATAMASGLTLVTHNASHFQRVPGLQLADWLADDDAQ